MVVDAEFLYSWTLFWFFMLFVYFLCYCFIWWVYTFIYGGLGLLLLSFWVMEYCTSYFQKWHTHTAAFELFASMNDTFMSPAGQTGRWRRYVLDLSICSSILSSATRLVCDAYNFSTVSCLLAMCSASCIWVYIKSTVTSRSLSASYCIIVLLVEYACVERLLCQIMSKFKFYLYVTFLYDAFCTCVRFHNNNYLRSLLTQNTV